MEMQNATSQLSAFEKLPKELKTMIFAAISDVDSLVAVVLSGRELYESFQPDQASIMGQVLAGQFQILGVFEDAALALEARSLPRDHWTPERITEHFHACVPQQFRFFERQNLSSIRAIDKFHRVVQQLAEGLATKSLNAAQRILLPSTTGEPKGATSKELARIIRALYRIDLYSTFFADPRARSELSHKRQLEVFWSNYAPWEIEQMACVMEYLQAELVSVYEYLVMQDPDWNHFFARTGALRFSGEVFLQSQISRGIEYVHHVISSHVHGQSQELTAPWKQDDLTFCDDFLAVGLDGSVQHSAGLTLNEYEQNPEAQEEAGQIIKPAAVEDGDDGPEKVWRWSHQEESSSSEPGHGFVRSRAQIKLRDCGYVFWDGARLSHLELMKEPFCGLAGLEIFERQQRDFAKRHKKIEARAREFVAAGHYYMFRYRPR